jgi:hypothetical protein
MGDDQPIELGDDSSEEALVEGEEELEDEDEEDDDDDYDDDDDSDDEEYLTVMDKYGFCNLHSSPFSIFPPMVRV